MKITHKLEKARAENRTSWSFEYFPPKTPQGVENLFDRMDRMYQLGPEFIDVTWGAGGTTSDTTLEICTNASKHGGLETCMHLTCTNMDIEKIEHALKVCHQAGIQNILALRGDPPKGQEKWTAIEGGFEYAVDLVKYIREKYGDFYGIGVAGYPEGHIDSEDKSKDIYYLKDKVDAGADFIVTQLFYDVDNFIQWYDECRQLGITIPIFPGIMPIHTYAGWKRMTTLCKTLVPKQIEEDLEAIKDNDQAVKEYGIQLCINMIQRLIDHGVKHFHFYTLNLEVSVVAILEGLKLVAPIENVRALPWKKSTGKRSKENVRPICWMNRPKSYVERTDSWDDFPNGRWGDSRSPAFGELDGYGSSLKLKKDEALESWGYPKSISDVGNVVANYLEGQISSLPWCDLPLFLESSKIKTELVNLNRNEEVFTITSQPSVNGVPSTDPVHGWGGAGGYVYQKAYLEFFVSQEKFEILVERISKTPSITYYVTSNDMPEVRTNCKSEGRPTALTWGVFPGSEIVQPTIIDVQSFAIWKSEAFELWHQWANLYEPGSETRKLLEHIRQNWLLVNIVDNDYVNGNIFSIFHDL